MSLRLSSESTSIHWHGAFFAHHSLALVNRELSLALLEDANFKTQFTLEIDHFDTPLTALRDDVRFAPLAERMRATASTPALTIRHRWPPEFGRPAAGKLVLIQPWEFGSLPRHWVSAIHRNVDEVWVPSHFVRETYITSGVSEDKVVVVPNGVNTRQFHPGVTPYDWTQGTANRKQQTASTSDSETYKFLFVGGTIARKGIDVLLDAYDRAFTAKDPVELIIKDFGTDSFYANQGAATLIRALQAKPGGAKIVYLNHDMTEAEIAGLYAACDCLVHPYRGEGYGLPIAEAMACGKPTIVTDFGAALDFANGSNAYMLPATIQHLTEKKIGDMATVDFPFWADPNRDALIDLLRHVVANREESQNKGAQAARDIATSHTWDTAARCARERLTNLTTLTTATTGQFVLPMGLGNIGIGGLRLSDAAESDWDDTSADSLFLPDHSDTPGLQVTAVTYRERKEMALQETRQGNWQDAVLQLEECLSEQADDWDVINALGVACFRAGAKERAFALLQRGIEASPNARDFHHNLAFLLLAENQPAAAIEHALQALQSTPQNMDIRRTVARVQEALLKQARQLLRGVPDKQRAKARRAPAYRALMEGYARAEQALKVKSEDKNENKNNNGTQTTLPIALPPATISLCMIVKNEERFLRNCLESAREFVDEIVIVDTGSTDSTRDIAREYGAKIIDYTWNDDFAEARNLSLEHATSSWALWLDADEEIAPGAGPSFRQAILHAPAHVGGYMVAFHNWLTSATRPASGAAIGGEMAMHHACRLFRLVEGVKFEGRIHEQNLRSLQALGYTYARLDGLLIDHFGYAGEIMTLRNKHERFIRMLTREVEECPDEDFRVFHQFNLANSYFTFGDMENAARYFSMAAEGVCVEEEFAVTLFVEWATALHRLQRPWEGLDVCIQADESGMQQAAIEFARGYCLLHTSQYDLAESAFRTAIAKGKIEAQDPSVTQTGDVGASSFKAQYGLALALVGQDRYPEAIESCHEALTEQPGMIETRYLLSIGLTKLDRTYEASQELETILLQSPQHIEARRDLGRIYYAAKDYAQALPHLRQMVWDHPEDSEALAWLANCCEDGGLLDETRDCYERLRRLNPMSVEVCVNMGRVLAALGDPAEALECYTEAIQRAPDHGNSYFNAGDLLYQLGYYDRAAEVYMAGLQVNPDHGSGFFVLGNCFFQTKAYAAAVVSYRRALALTPSNREARHNLQLAEENALAVGQELPTS